MALHWHRREESGACLALWQIEPGELGPGDIPGPLLTPARLQAIQHPRVREEFLAGRRALACATPPGRTLQVQKDGKPNLLPEGNVSLSHTRGFAAAQFHPTLPCGIDLEPVEREVSDSVQTRFLHLEELNALHDSTAPVIAWWCAKEAVYKAHGRAGLNFKEAIRLELDFSPEGGFRGVGWSRDSRLRRWEIRGERPGSGTVWVVWAVESFP
ncbi:MAG: 4'-phosphopantetheinyl transferase superfamily protein [Gemmatimonadota bacterium]